MIRPARPDDIAAVTGIARAAYLPFVAAIGREPAPMVADFAALAAAGELWVTGFPPDGYIVWRVYGAEAHIENVAVDPAAHGLGLGKHLIYFAEVQAAAAGALRMTLYTNVAMGPNLTLYPHLGYRETGRRREGGFDRVYFEKRLNAQ